MQGGRCSGSEGVKSTHIATVEVPSVECLHFSDSFQPCWTDLPPMLTSRASHAAAAMGSCLYAIGGQSGAATMSSVEQLDVLNACWRTVASMHSGRKYCSAASLDGACSHLHSVCKLLSIAGCCRLMVTAQRLCFAWHEMP